jgi:hypothetical protein
LGTITYHKPLGVKAVDAIKAELGAEWCANKLVAATATREAVFIVGKYHEPDSEVYVPDADGFVKALLVFKLSLAPKSHYNFGYKDMSETSGPYGCEAPLSIIAEASPLRDGPVPADGFSSLKSAREYRERSKAMAEVKALKRGLKVGDIVELKEPLSFGGVMRQRFTVDRIRVRGNKGVSTVFRAEDGTLCGVSARYLIGAKIVQKRAP